MRILKAFSIVAAALVAAAAGSASAGVMVMTFDNGSYGYAGSANPLCGALGEPSYTEDGIIAISYCATFQSLAVPSSYGGVGLSSGTLQATTFQRPGNAPFSLVSVDFGGGGYTTLDGYLNGVMVGRFILDGVGSGINFFGKGWWSDLTQLEYCGYCLTTFGNVNFIDNVTLGRATPLTGGVPEPDTWALIVLACGALGAALRSRRGPVAEPAPRIS